MRSRRRSAIALLLAVIATQALTAQAGGALQLVAQADDALAGNRYYEAVDAYRAALNANPNYLDAAMGLAESYYLLGEYDEAQRYIERSRTLARRNPAVINLAGRIAIGRGDLERARASFEEVRAIEPNNVDAAIGQAELALAQGRSAEAAASLERALRLNPEHRKALLSLVLISEYQGEPEIARDYLEIARSVHRDESEVHVLAAQYFLRSGDLVEAGRAARTAQAIDPDNRAATRIRATLAVALESFLEARTIAEELISRDRADTYAWYTRALASYRLGDTAIALESIRTALRIAPNDESLRIWAEWLALRELDLDHEVRAELAAARAEEAATLERGFRYERAGSAYRRAVQLAPLDLELRRDYAELFRKMGFAASYVRELAVLQENGVESIELSRTFEVYRNALASSVSRRWGIDQFTLARTRIPVGIYLSADASLPYPRMTDALLAFMERTIASRSGVEIVDGAVVASFAQAFSAAREAGADFYAAADGALTDRMTAIEADLSVARTGSGDRALRSVRTGPGHATAAIDSFAAELAEALPVRARLIRREAGRVVLDLGARDAIEVEQVFDVVRPADVSIAPRELAYVYRPERVVGTVTVTAVDDLIAEGVLEPAGIVDLVTVGDVAIPRPAEDDDEAEEAEPRAMDADLFPILYERVRRLR